MANFSQGICFFRIMPSLCEHVVLWLLPGVFKYYKETLLVQNVPISEAL